MCWIDWCTNDDMCVCMGHWESGAAYLVTSNLFFLMLSTPGFSRSGSPFFPVCFLDFLFTAWLMVLAQCFGSSCKVEGETGKRAPFTFYTNEQAKRQEQHTLEELRVLVLFAYIITKTQTRRDLWALSQEEGRVWCMHLAEERTSGEVLLS